MTTTPSLPPVPMVDLQARHRRVGAEVERRVLAVLRSGRYIGGPVLAEAEAALAERLGFRFAVGVGSGTDALILGLMALGVGPGQRVAVPALSFFATTEAVLRVGAEPVFVDVLPDRPLMDPAAVPGDVDLVLPVHLFGARSPGVQDLPGSPRVFSDAAQCMGWGHGRPAGVAAALSLYPTKTLGAGGDAGAVLTDDPDVAARVRALGSHGLSAPYVHHRVGERVGANCRMDPIQAAILLAHLGDLDRRIARRRAIADRYDAELRGLRLPLRDPRDGVHHYVARAPERDRLRAGLAARGIGSAIYYPTPMDAQPVFTGRAELDPGDSACANAAQFCRETLALPCNGELDDAQVDRVIAAVNDLA